MRRLITLEHWELHWEVAAASELSLRAIYGSTWSDLLFLFCIHCDRTAVRVNSKCPWTPVSELALVSPLSADPTLYSALAFTRQPA